MLVRKDARIFVAGHAGLIGSALLRILEREGYSQIITLPRDRLDLQSAVCVDKFFGETRPEYVLLAAGRVGGIIENDTYPASFMEENISVQLNVLMAAQKVDVKRLILFGSSCMYPKECSQPMAENILLSGKLEPTSLPYAVSKLAGVYMCLAYNKQYGGSSFIPLIPNSVYGPNDNFDPNSAHVLSALMSRFHDAKVRATDSITLWGSGSPRREFVHADDIADACLHLLQHDISQLELPVNIGVGSDISIRELAETMADVVGYKGSIDWDRTKPDGTPRKLLDGSRMSATGWGAKIPLDEGLRQTYKWYLENQCEIS
jgi:GDP-L-fucose synthase